MDPDFEVITIVLGAFTLLLLAGLAALALRARQLGAQAQTSAAQATARDRELAVAQAHIAHQDAELSRFAPIKDAEAEAARIREQARAWATSTETATRLAAEQASAQSRAAVAAADAQAAHVTSSAHREAQQLLTVSRSQAAEIVASAQAEAERTAGDALVALRESKRLETTIRAMQNVIEGYGDRYVVPTAGLLDELADELGFAEAGQKLKQARQHTKDLIASQSAATCDYVEANRRATAIEFVLDAFNGKVDTALADVRDDNHGTIEQKIRDAYALVNHNGKAFRDARVLPGYMAARLDELRWAVVAQELKAKEREEQRALKERIREEEKAQREFEKALREAQKERESLEKAMEKARREVARASDDQRAKLEEQLRLLTEQLQAAEKKNERALSMAQQTKAGHVYVISNVGSFGEHVFKIGMTRRLEPLDRIRELGDASVPFEFDVHALLSSGDAPGLERALHKAFVKHQVNKVNPRKEFFRVPLGDLHAAIDGMGIQASWTLVSEAREYKETQAIERAMAEKTFDEAAWARAQLAAEATDTVAAEDRAAE